MGLSASFEYGTPWAFHVTFFQSLAETSVYGTVMILRFHTDSSRQTVQIQIRLLLKEQSDPALHCLPFH